MAKVAPVQSNFSGGEFSPFLEGRIDSKRYETGLSLCENYLPTIQGPFTRMPGSTYVANSKVDSKVRLEKFQFSNSQTYVLEFGDLYVRIFQNHGVLESSPGVPLEVVTTYTAAQVFDLKFAQSGDILYIFHPSQTTRELVRLGATSWVFADLIYLDGPYMPVNTTTTTLQSAGGSPVVVNASSTAGINGGQGFLATDVGRHLRVLNNSNQWCFATILSRVSSTQITVQEYPGYGVINLTATTQWRLGAWSNTVGFPSWGVFHEDRLFTGGVPSFPQRIDASATSNYGNFQPTNFAGTITDSMAISFGLNSSDVNATIWATSDEKGLLIGTSAGEWNVRPSTQTEVLTPTNVTARKATNWGSSNVAPVQIGKSAMFVQAGGRKIRELTYFYDVEGFKAADMTEIAQHILGVDGAVQLAVMKTPHAALLAVRRDGQLAYMTYDRDQEIRVGWGRRIAGGTHSLPGSHAMIESAVVIPAPGGIGEEVWMSVARYINGSIVRHIEYTAKFFETGDNLRDACFLDSSLVYDNPLAVSGITNASPAVVTSAAHGLSNGDLVTFSDVAGMTLPDPDLSTDEDIFYISQVNDRVFKVASVTANTFALKDPATGLDVDSSSFSPFVSSGTSRVRKLVSTVSGLGHLEGQIVGVLADGTVQAQKSVVSGAITLDTPAAVVRVGLPLRARARGLRPQAGSADGPALGKNQRAHDVGLLVHNTLGIKVGAKFSEMQDMTARFAEEFPGQAVPLFAAGTADLLRETIDMDYTDNAKICIEQSDPLPGTILAVNPRMMTVDP